MSYNGVESTFDRIHANSLHKAGYLGKDILIAFYDVDRINFERTELKHTVLPGREILAGVEGHATQMALIAAGAVNTQGNIGIAPQAKISSDPLDEHLIKIVSNSILGRNLLAAQYTMPPGGVSPGVFLNPPDPAVVDNIYVIIAGNSGPGVNTNMGFGIPDNYYPVHGNIIVTVAVDENNRITTTSSSCGIKTHLFCIAVPSPGPTSPTAPIVSGAIALLMEAVPGRPLNQYVHAILNTATPLPDSSPNETGVGLLNVEAAWNYLRANP